MELRIQHVLGCTLALVFFCIDINAGRIVSDSALDPAIRSARAQSENAGGKNSKKRGAKRKLSRCVEYSQEIGETAMTLGLANDCKKPLECTMTWFLACHRQNGKIERSRQSETFYLGDGTEHTVAASAAACGDDGWSIRNVRWTCRDAASARL